MILTCLFVHSILPLRYLRHIERVTAPSPAAAPATQPPTAAVGAASAVVPPSPPAPAQADAPQAAPRSLERMYPVLGCMERWCNTKGQVYRARVGDRVAFADATSGLFPLGTEGLVVGVHAQARGIHFGRRWGQYCSQAAVVCLLRTMGDSPLACEACVVYQNWACQAGKEASIRSSGAPTCSQSVRLCRKSCCTVYW